MKIAFITSAFFESTFPLIRELKKDHEVHCFSIISQSFLTPPNFDLSQNYKGEIGVVNDVDKKKIISNELKFYFNNDIGFIKLTITNRTKKKYLRQIGQEILNYNYDVIHFIGINFNTRYLLGFFKNKKIIFSLHEVDTSRALTKGWDIKFIIKRFLLKKTEKIIYNRTKTRFIVFSKNEYNKLVHKKSVKAEFCQIIKFGLFDVFREFNKKATFKLPNKPYFLLYGYMNKYKGIDVFFDAAMKMEKNGVQFVAAGKDVEGFLSRQKYIPDNLLIINKFLSDSEISYLIKNCYAVVMPYRSASQSGIPPTALTFNKPIIASNVSGVNEYLTCGYNSLTFNNYTSDDLIKVINEMNRENIYSTLLKNIRLNPFGNDESIETIAFKTVEEYKKLLHT
jgi:glycosyltransferase involved in cell wall biosynthesis